MVSVIVPVYNVEKYLGRCINSILAQTYEDIEVILVDDGSTDNSGEVCDEYAIKDSRIRVIHKENGGLSEARNTGIDSSSGDYLCFIDSDDCINNEYVEILYNMCIEYNCDIAQCGYIEFSDTRTEYNAEAEVTEYSGLEMMDKIYDANMYPGSIIVCNKLYKKMIFDNMRFSKGIIHEDEDIMYRIYYGTDKIAVTNKILYYYFVNNNGITKSRYSVKRLDILDIYEKRLEFCDGKELDDFKEKSCYRYLLAILNHYYLVDKYIDDKRQIKKELKKRYRNLYRKTHGYKWKVKRRILLRMNYFVPSLYGKVFLENKSER